MTGCTSKGLKAAKIGDGRVLGGEVILTSFRPLKCDDQNIGIRILRWRNRLGRPSTLATAVLLAPLFCYRWRLATLGNTTVETTQSMLLIPTCSFFEIVPCAAHALVSPASASKSLIDFPASSTWSQKQGLIVGLQSDGTRGTATLQVWQQCMEGWGNPTS